MRIFHYHPYALIYIGQGLADADRETPGEWVVPAYATKIRAIAPNGKQARSVRCRGAGMEVSGDASCRGASGDA